MRVFQARGPVCGGRRRMGVIDERQEAFVVGGVSQTDGDQLAAAPAPVPAQPFHSRMLAFVGERVVEAPAARQPKAALVEGLAERLLTLRRFQNKGLAVLALRRQARPLDRHVAAGGDLLGVHVGEATNTRGGLPGGLAQRRSDFGARPAEHDRLAVIQHDAAAVFHDTGMGEADLFEPVLDLGPRLAGRADHRGAEPAKAVECRQRGREIVGVVIQQAVVEVGENGQHISIVAGGAR